MKPEVSVVMSVRNAPGTVGASIDSILRQEGVNFEVVIIDDGSTDDTPKVLQQYSSESRIRLFRQDHRGLTRALIRGCAEAAAPYIARHDAADESAPRRLLLQKEALDADPGLAFVSCWTEFVGPAGEPLFIQKGTGKASGSRSILDDENPRGVIDGPTHHGSVMFRKEAYVRAGGYRADFFYGQDWDLWYRLAEVGKFRIIEEVLYTARFGMSDISALHRARQERLARLSREALRRRRGGEPEEPVLTEARKVVPAKTERMNPAGALYFVGECLRRRGDRRSLRYFRQAIAANPFHWRSWVRLAQMKLSGS